VLALWGMYGTLMVAVTQWWNLKIGKGRMAWVFRCIWNGMANEKLYRRMMK
jgi:hypothetical protein